MSRPDTTDQRRTPSPEMVCVTLQRPPHFWRFACELPNTGDLLERLASLADNEESDLSWDDAELIASQVLAHRHPDHPQAAPPHDR